MADAAPSTVPKKAKKKTPVKKKKKAPARHAATAGLVLALGAAGAALVLAGWLWYRLDHRAGVTELPRRVAALEGGLRDLADRGDALEGTVAELGQRQETLEEGLAALRGALGKSRHDWVLEEAAQLLLVANSRLKLAADLDTALAALRQADRRLETLADPALLEVREEISREIVALESVSRPDLAGVTLRLGALADGVDRWPLATRPHFQDASPPPSTPPAPAGDRLSRLRALAAEVWRDLRGLVTVRRIEARRPPLLPESQSYFLRENLRLMLHGAQLAALRGDQGAYRHHLATASRWLRDYYDTEAEGVGRALAQLEELAAVTLRPALPDLTASLEMLRALQKGSPR